MGEFEDRQQSPGVHDEADALKLSLGVGGEQTVDIHKPKPVHSWREFASEIGVIVIGILIALAGEQGVEAIHWRLKADDAQHAIAREIANDVSNYAERIVVEPCLKAQLDRIEADILGTGKAALLVPQHTASWTTVLVHPERSWSDQVWNSTAAEGSQSHLPDKTRLGLEEYYGEVRRLREIAQAEQDTGDALLALTKTAAIDSSIRFQLVQSIEAERSRSNDFAQTSRQQLERIRTSAPEAFSPENRSLWYDFHRFDSTARWCRDHGLPLAPSPSL